MIITHFQHTLWPLHGPNREQRPYPWKRNLEWRRCADCLSLFASACWSIDLNLYYSKAKRSTGHTIFLPTNVIDEHLRGRLTLNDDDEMTSEKARESVNEGIFLATLTEHNANASRERHFEFRYRSSRWNEWRILSSFKMIALWTLRENSSVLGLNTTELYRCWNGDYLRYSWLMRRAVRLLEPFHWTHAGVYFSFRGCEH